MRSRRRVMAKERKNSYISKKGPGIRFAANNRIINMQHSTQFLFTLKAWCAKKKKNSQTRRREINCAVNIINCLKQVRASSSRDDGSREGPQRVQILCFLIFMIFFSRQLCSLFPIDEFLCGIKLKGHREVTATILVIIPSRTRFTTKTFKRELYSFYD